MLTKVNIWCSYVRQLTSIQKRFIWLFEEMYYVTMYMDVLIKDFKIHKLKH